MLDDYIRNYNHELCSLFFCGYLIFVFELRKCALYESSLWCFYGFLLYNKNFRTFVKMVLKSSFFLV